MLVLSAQVLAEVVWVLAEAVKVLANTVLSVGGRCTCIGGDCIGVVQSPPTPVQPLRSLVEVCLWLDCVHKCWRWL